MVDAVVTQQADDSTDDLYVTDSELENIGRSYIFTSDGSESKLGTVFWNKVSEPDVNMESGAEENRAHLYSNHDEDRKSVV